MTFAGASSRATDPVERARRLRLTLVCYAAWIAGYEAVASVAERLPSHDLSSSLDARIPLCPSFVWVYASTYVLPFVAVFAVEHAAAFDRALRAIGIAAVCAFVVFLAFPVAFPRPGLGHGLAERFLALEHAHDAGANHLPSLHVANAFIVYLAVRGQWLGRTFDLAAFALALAIALSTLLVKMHLVVDVLGGVALAWAAHALAGVIPAALARPEPRSRA